MSRFITVAIHTYERAAALRTILENDGITVELATVNLEVPGFSSGVRVRIQEEDLPKALRLIENLEVWNPATVPTSGADILVPVDLSEHSYKAALVACHMASRRKCGITLLYSYIDPYIAGNIQFNDTLSYDSRDTGARHMLEDNARRLLEQFCHRLRQAMRDGQAAAVRITSAVLEGVPEDAIIEYAKMTPPQLIVMGTRQAQKKSADMIGSVTAEVLDEGRFMVLTVPEPTPFENSVKPSKILFFSTLSQEDVLALDALRGIYGAAEISVTIVHIPRKRRFSEKSTDKALRTLSDFCRKTFDNYHFVAVPVKASDSEKEFARLQAQQHFDLIVAPNRRRNALSRLLNPGLAHRILFHTDIPMLVIPV